MRGVYDIVGTSINIIHRSSAAAVLLKLGGLRGTTYPSLAEDALTAAADAVCLDPSLDIFCVLYVHHVHSLHHRRGSDIDKT